jgi:hypothetical protein
MPTYIANLTDVEQSKREEAQFEGGSPTFEDAKTRVVAKGLQTATQKTANAGSSIRSNAGVIMPPDDKPGLIVEELQGKR